VKQKNRRPKARAWPAPLQALILRLLQKAPKGGTRAAAGSILMTAKDAVAKARRAINQNVREAVAAESIELLQKECSGTDRKSRQKQKNKQESEAARLISVAEKKLREILWYLLLIFEKMQPPCDDGRSRSLCLSDSAINGGRFKGSGS